MTHLDHFISSSRVRITLAIIGALVVLALVFHAGVAFGAHHGAWGRMSGDRGFRHPFFPQGFALPHGFIPNEHGAVGTVRSVSPAVTIETRDGAIRPVAIATSTLVRARGEEGTTTLSVGDKVIVIGQVNEQGRIDAKFINVLSVATSTR
jgi:hypothetical protein